MAIVLPFRKPLTERERLRKALDLALAHRSVCYRAMATTQRAWRDADDKVHAINRQMRGLPTDDPKGAA